MRRLARLCVPLVLSLATVAVVQRQQQRHPSFPAASAAFSKQALRQLTKVRTLATERFVGGSSPLASLPGSVNADSSLSRWLRDATGAARLASNECSDSYSTILLSILAPHGELSIAGSVTDIGVLAPSPLHMTCQATAPDIGDRPVMRTSLQRSAWNCGNRSPCVPLSPSTGCCEPVAPAWWENEKNGSKNVNLCSCHGCCTLGRHECCSLGTVKPERTSLTDIKTRMDVKEREPVQLEWGRVGGEHRNPRWNPVHEHRGRARSQHE